MGECSAERKEEIRQFASKSFNKIKAEEYVKTAKCLNHDQLYIQGEPGSRNEASIEIMYEYKADFWPKHWQESYA